MAEAANAFVAWLLLFVFFVSQSAKQSARNVQ